jgi:hypothetical protein
MSQFIADVPEALPFRALFAENEPPSLRGLVFVLANSKNQMNRLALALSVSLI